MTAAPGGQPASANGQHTAAAPAALLDARAVTRRFGGLVAVNAVDLQIPRGAIVGLIGPNGAGKTTLFNIVAGFYAPHAGRVVFDGQDITGRPPHEVTARGIARTAVSRRSPRARCSCRAPRKRSSPDRMRRSVSHPAKMLAGAPIL